MTMSFDEEMQIARLLRDAARNHAPNEGSPCRSEEVIYLSLVIGTRRKYLERLVHQINGSFESGWYDACAVMIRRLVETLIIEVFESNKLAHKIKDRNDDFYFLNDLITAILSEETINISRNAKKSLPELKSVGDKSAHSRHHTAQRKDIQKLIPHLRDIVQELIGQAKFH